MGNKVRIRLFGSLRGKAKVTRQQGWEAWDECLEGDHARFYTEIEVNNTRLFVIYEYESQYTNGNPGNVETFPVPVKVFTGDDDALFDITDLLDGVLDESIYEAIETSLEGEYGV